MWVRGGSVSESPGISIVLHVPSQPAGRPLHCSAASTLCPVTDSAAGGHCLSYVSLYDTLSTHQSAPLHPGSVCSLSPVEEGVSPPTGSWVEGLTHQYTIPCLQETPQPFQRACLSLLCLGPSKAPELFGHLRVPTGSSKVLQALLDSFWSFYPFKQHCWNCSFCHPKQWQGCGHGPQGRSILRRSESGFMPFSPPWLCHCMSGFTPWTERDVPFAGGCGNILCHWFSCC